MMMIRTITTISFTIIAALALAATTALAQGIRISGTVSRIDPATRTIYFTDGSVVQLKPGAVAMVNGREVAFEALTPGSNTTVVSPAPGTETVASQTGQPAMDVGGTVARVDRQTGVITLQDGRSIQLSGQSFVWQAVPTDSIQPGAQIYVHNAQPLAMAPASNTGAWVGTVKSVDKTNSLIMLNDETFVSVSPTTRLQSGGRTLSISELRPGDRVAVWPRGTTRVSGPYPVADTGAIGPSTTTVPRGDASPASAIDAGYIEVTRQPR
jgi:hypothetical protein